MSFGAIIRLLTLALQLWVQRESRREELQLDADEKEWNRLRELGTPESTLSADRLRQRIVRGSGIVGQIGTLPTTDSSISKGPSNSNS